MTTKTQALSGWTHLLACSLFVTGMGCGNDVDGAGAAVPSDTSQDFEPKAPGPCNRSAPCDEGQGACDSNSDCKSGLVCTRRGVCDEPGASTFSGGEAHRLYVLVTKNGGFDWRSVGCSADGRAPNANDSDDEWTIVNRQLRNQDGLFLYCEEGWADGTDCECSKDNAEGYHAVAEPDFRVDSSEREHGNHLTASVAQEYPLYIFPNNAHEFCLAVNRQGTIENRASGGQARHSEASHNGRCNRWCWGSGCLD